MKGIIGRKRGMTQVYGPAGEIVPVTVIEAGPCPVVQVKTEEHDGYNALQLGFDEIREKLVTRPVRGHFTKAGVSPRRRLREVRTEGVEEYQPGQEIKADIFEVGERVDVRGVSKGRGFSGGMKRWGFHGGKKSHGSKNHRQAGSIGQCATPARVWKGHKMAGQYGAKAVTMRNLEVVQVDAERNLLLLKGAVPGARNGFLFVHKKD